MMMVVVVVVVVMTHNYSLLQFHREQGETTVAVGLPPLILRKQVFQLRLDTTSVCCPPSPKS